VCLTLLPGGVLLASCGSEVVRGVRNELLISRAVGTWKCANGSGQTQTVAVSREGLFRVAHAEADPAEALILEGTWELNGSSLTIRYAGGAPGDPAVVFEGLPTDPEDGARLRPGGESQGSSDEIIVEVNGAGVRFSDDGASGPESVSCDQVSSENPKLTVPR